jgi:hypothetical protein
LKRAKVKAIKIELSSRSNILQLIFRTMVPFAKNSLQNGVQLLIDVETFDYAVSSTASEGAVISILHQLDIPIMKNIGIIVQPGQDVQVLNSWHCYFSNMKSFKVFPFNNSHLRLLSHRACFIQRMVPEGDLYHSRDNAILRMKLSSHIFLLKMVTGI